MQTPESRQKMVLVTGASRGIGWAVAKALAEEYRLILHASREESLSDLVSEIGGDHEVLCADFSDSEATADFCKRLKKTAGKSLFAVVNNAGIAMDKPLIYQSVETMDAMLNVNVKAPLLIAKVALKIFMANNEGVLINMSSCVGRTGNAFQVVYSMTKAAMTAMSKSVAKEVGVLKKEHRIRSLSIAPGFVETDMTAGLSEAVREQYLGMIPSSYFGSVEEIAKVVRFAISEDAGYVNGTEIAVNGGLV